MKVKGAINSACTGMSTQKQNVVGNACIIEEKREEEERDREANYMQRITLCTLTDRILAIL